MPRKQRELEDHIREEIRKTGYPLEIQISDILEKNWIVFNNEPFLDEDENKTRAIDIYAIHDTEPLHLQVKQKPVFFIMTRLIVECKKSDTHAWVFFTRPNAALPIGTGQTLDFLQVFSKGKKIFLDELDDFPWSKLHYNRFNRVAHTYAEVKLLGQSPEKHEIFEASNRLMKYASFETKEESERIVRDESNRNVLFLFPTIAFDGKLYEAIIRAGKIRLLKRTHILLETSRVSRSTENVPNYLIDVVAKAEFAKYIKSLNNDIVTIHSFFLSKEKKLAHRADAYL